MSPCHDSVYFSRHNLIGSMRHGDKGEKEWPMMCRLSLPCVLPDVRCTSSRLSAALCPPPPSSPHPCPLLPSRVTSPRSWPTRAYPLPPRSSRSRRLQPWLVPHALCHHRPLSSRLRHAARRARHRQLPPSRPSHSRRPRRDKARRARLRRRPVPRCHPSAARPLRYLIYRRVRAMPHPSWRHPPAQVSPSRPAAARNRLFRGGPHGVAVHTDQPVAAAGPMWFHLSPRRLHPPVRHHSLCCSSHAPVLSVPAVAMLRQAKAYCRRHKSPSETKQRPLPQQVALPPTMAARTPTARQEMLGTRARCVWRMRPCWPCCAASRHARGG